MKELFLTLGKKWKAVIHYLRTKVQVCLELFSGEEAAARAYDETAGNIIASLVKLTSLKRKNNLVYKEKKND